MSKGPSKIAQIDEYLSGDIRPEHLAEFEKRLREETQMQQDVMLTKKVIEGIEGSAFKEMLSGIRKKFDAAGNRPSQDDSPSPTR